MVWHLSERGGEPVEWRFCQCKEWSGAPIKPGTRHLRERVPGADVEICYHADHATQTITMLRIHSKGGPPES